MEVFGLLGPEELGELIKSFERIEQAKGNGEGLTLREFVQVMHNALVTTPKLEECSSGELAAHLQQAARLFDEIDIDGDNTVTLEELIQHVIEDGHTASLGGNAGSAYKEQHTSTHSYLYERRNWREPLAQRSSHIKWLRFTDKVGLIAVTEERTRRIKLYDDRARLVFDMDTELQEHEWPFCLLAQSRQPDMEENNEEDNHKHKQEEFVRVIDSIRPKQLEQDLEDKLNGLMGRRNGLERAILGVEFCPSDEFSEERAAHTRKLGTLVTTSSDQWTSFFEILQRVSSAVCKVRRMSKVHTSRRQKLLWWSNIFRVMLSVDETGGGIRVWDVQAGGCVDGTPPTYRVCGMLQGHTSRVTSFLQLESLGLVVSASLDTNIILWRLADDHSGSNTRRKKIETFVEFDDTPNTFRSAGARSITRGQHVADTARPTDGSTDGDSIQHASIISNARHVIGEEMGTLQDHQCGILDLASVCDEKVILSAGFELEIYCWCPIERVLLCKLTGHRAPLVSIHAAPVTNPLDNRQQAISLDSKGIVRLWTISYDACVSRRVFCTQEVKPWAQFLPRSSLLVPALAHFRSPPSKNAIIVRDKRLYSLLVADMALRMYEATEKPESAPTAESVVPIGAGFNEATQTFCAALGRSVWVWNAKTGKLDRIFKDLVESEIASLTVCSRGRKLFVGCQSGAIRIFNYLNGSQLRANDTGHNGDVTDLTFVEDDGCLVSVSGDNSLVVHAELAKASSVTGLITGYELTSLRKVYGAHTAAEAAAPAAATATEITHVVVSRDLGLIATGDDDGGVMVWDFSTFNCEGQCCLPERNGPVVGLAFAGGNISVLITVDGTSNIILWPVRPDVNRYKTPIAAFTLKQGSALSASVFHIPVERCHANPALSKLKALKWGLPKAHLIAVGDEDGYVHVFEFDHLLANATKLTDLPHERHNFNPRRKITIRNVRTTNIVKDKTALHLSETNAERKPGQRPQTARSFGRINFSARTLASCALQDEPPVRPSTSRGDRYDSCCSGACDSTDTSGCNKNNGKKTLLVIAHWRAHSNPVVSISPAGIGSRMGAFLITCTFNNIIKLWTVTGLPAGLLRCEFDPLLSAAPVKTWAFNPTNIDPRTRRGAAVPREQVFSENSSTALMAMLEKLALSPEQVRRNKRRVDIQLAIKAFEANKTQRLLPTTVADNSNVEASAENKFKRLEILNKLLAEKDDQHDEDQLNGIDFDLNGRETNVKQKKGKPKAPLPERALPSDFLHREFKFKKTGMLKKNSKHNRCILQRLKTPPPRKKKRKQTKGNNKKNKQKTNQERGNGNNDGDVVANSNNAPEISLDALAAVDTLEPPATSEDLSA